MNNLKFLTVSIDPEDYNTIEKYCKNNSFNRSEFIRKTVLDRINKETKKNAKTTKTTKNKK